MFLFLGKIFTKFLPEKYDFDLHNEFFREKNDLNLLGLVDFFLSNLHIFMTSSSR
jgi:hypothetical protein